MWTSSTAAPAATDGWVPAGAERNVSIGRRRLPPAVSASAPISATRPGWPAIDAVEQLLDLAQVLGEARSSPDDVERGAHRAVAVCSATIEPPKSRNCVPSNPLSSISAARSSAPGNRRTLAGRYV